MIRLSVAEHQQTVRVWHVCRHSSGGGGSSIGLSCIITLGCSFAMQALHTRRRLIRLQSVAVGQWLYAANRGGPDPANGVHAKAKKESRQGARSAQCQ